MALPRSLMSGDKLVREMMRSARRPAAAEISDRGPGLKERLAGGLWSAVEWSAVCEGFRNQFKAYRQGPRPARSRG